MGFSAVADLKEAKKISFQLSNERGRFIYIRPALLNTLN